VRKKKTVKAPVRRTVEATWTVEGSSAKGREEGAEKGSSMGPKSCAVRSESHAAEGMAETLLLRAEGRWRKLRDGDKGWLWLWLWLWWVVREKGTVEKRRRWWWECTIVSVSFSYLNSTQQTPNVDLVEFLTGLCVEISSTTWILVESIPKVYINIQNISPIMDIYLGNKRTHYFCFQKVSRFLRMLLQSSM